MPDTITERRRLAANDRTTIAEGLTRVLDLSYQSVSVEGDRIYFVASGLAVTLIVASVRPVVVETAGGVCPFCGSADLNTARRDGYEPRIGCLTCNAWIDPPRLKRTR